MNANQINEMQNEIGTVEQGRLQYLTFKLNDEYYAIEIRRVHEIRRWRQLTPVPNTPAHLCGVLNLRGAIVPIVDLRLFFNMPFMPYSKTTVVVILNVMQRTVGIVVDAVLETQMIDPDNVLEAPNAKDIAAAFIKGIAKLDNTRLLLLNIDTLLSSEQIG